MNGIRISLQQAVKVNNSFEFDRILTILNSYIGINYHIILTIPKDDFKQIKKWDGFYYSKENIPKYKGFKIKVINNE